MTIEELKERVRLNYAEEQLSHLAPEILALVEAVNRWKGQHYDWVDGLWKASDAFNAKLEAL